MRRRPTSATRSRRPAARSVPSAGAASAKRENLKVRKDPEAKAQLEMTRKAEKLFMEGLAEAGGTIDSKGKIHFANDEENEGENAAEAASSEKEKSPKRGVRWSLRVKETNGEEHIVSPYEITREEVLGYLKKSKRGLLQEKTYFPVRKDTPSVLIASIKGEGINVIDRPIAMQARKARQAQKPPKIYTNANGVKVTGHSLTAQEVLEVVDRLDRPEAIVREKEHEEVRFDEYGDETVVIVPERFVVFVNLENDRTCVAILEFDSEMSEENIVRDGKGDAYHTTVTVLEPDAGYDERLMQRGYTSEVEIKESPVSESAYGGPPTAETEKGLPTDSIAQNSEKSTPSAQEISGKVSRSRNVTGETVTISKEEMELLRAN